MKLRRNRIVIDLDKVRADQQGRARAGRSRRVGRIFGIIAALLLLLGGGVVAGGYLWWRHYQNSPAYTLAILADAAQRNDTATVDGILDTDKVCDDFISQVRQHAGGSVATAIGSVWPTQANSALQTLSPRLKQTVHDEMVKELKRVTEPAKGKPFVLLALGITRFADIKEENKVAQVKVDINDEHLQLTMMPAMMPATQPGGARWRVTAVQDDKMVKQITDNMTQNLPATAGSEIQDQLRKQVDKLKKPGK
ncbi:MAG: hypothetical protein QOG23_1447 [Blastocatellia bacterium]|jgi:hypothetical protein|nr:hypothetical protein [Blastocatellia bacterium]